MKSRKMITGRATEDPIFTRLDQKRNPLHDCGPIQATHVKRVRQVQLGNQHSSVSTNTQQTRSKFCCFKLKFVVHSHVQLHQWSPSPKPLELAGSVPTVVPPAARAGGV
jgi:hypothetical protein